MARKSKHEISYNFKVLQNPGTIVSELFGL